MAKLDLDKVHNAATRLARLTSPEEREASGMGIGWLGFYDAVLREIISETGYYLPEPHSEEYSEEADRYAAPI